MVQSEELDMWFTPDLAVSAVHLAALGLMHPSRGISVRFPRSLTTVGQPLTYQTADMFHLQTERCSSAFLRMFSKSIKELYS
ncbi:DNA ligase, ATP-dependent, central [Artemisia annua]|uniref:DNA ligase, ATP-dependent, central n=1 Tax=Artemisia annua TaxID=35608 RepID=A0A2U1LFZ3_ARTAN|nr:DNA ligase, ATP-dependent, central [Artemisia annua]